MPKYRNIDLEDALVGVIRHMESVEEYREVLQNLQGVWDNLTLLGQMSGTGTDMSSTRQAFQALTSALLNQLAAETLRKCVQGIGAQAQVAVDILVRNLYERTADIGFLATDQDIRDFLLADQRAEDAAALAAARDRLQARFAEYVAKYSVYSDIVLLAPDGRVLARLDESAGVARTQAGLLRGALDTHDPYVETFDHIDLFPGQPRSLVYSCRVTAADGSVLGVLCLCFRFENEMAGIFAKLADADDWAVVTLLDAQGTVLASSDPFHVPVGARLSAASGTAHRIVRFRGQEYLAATRAAHGYQGYAGPGWSGHVMLPLQHAFSGAAETLPGAIPRPVLEAVMRGADLFGAALRRIPLQAERIQGDLNRSVWNGNVRQRGGAAHGQPGFSKILLWEISNTGARTKEVFERSIDNLHQTVLSATLDDSAFQAALAIDIMDRNLYERANDCRWWALTSAFRELLAAPGPQASQRIGEILAHIHGLYTVYSTLLVFDTEGRVVAVSRPEDQWLHGSVISEEWQRRVLALSDAQGYVVSSFAPTPLYGARRTYIYGAAVRAVDDDRVLGGVGIVFDAEPQFAAMLRDALPLDDAGQPQAGAFALFVDHEGSVIACSDAHLSPGTRLPLDADWYALEAGQRSAGVVELHGHYYALGACASSGYREYKGEHDAYRNEVTALVLVPLCPARQEIRRAPVGRVAVTSDRDLGAAAVELATFLIGEEWYALRSQEVIEAIDAAGLTPVPGAGRELAGYLRFDGLPIPVFELRHLLGGSADAASVPPGRQVVVVRRNETSRFGILVDALGEIPEVRAERLSELPGVLGGGSVLADAILPVDAAEGGRMMLVLGAERMHARLAAAVTEPLLRLARSDAAAAATPA